MRTLLACALALAGCSKILGIHDLQRTDGGTSNDGDAISGDAPDAIMLAGHDEDDDTVDDAIDNCPHLANMNQANSDSDTVGDACDPNPTTDGESIALFTPFFTDAGGWTFAGASRVVQNDHLVANTTGGILIATMSGGLGKDILEIGGTLTGATTGTRQITVAGSGTGSAQYYCQLYAADNSTATWSFTYTPDGAAYTNVQSGTGTAPIASGDFRLAMDHHPPTATCRTTWPGTTSPLAPATIPAITPIVYGFSVNGLMIELDWVVRIHTN